MKSRTKKLLGVLLTACLAVCVCLAVAACGDFPDFKNPSDPGSTGDSGYTVNVKSAGGLPLSNVLVTAKKGGEEVATGISSANGTVFFRDLEPDVYELSYSGLPAGYRAGAGTATFTTKASQVVDSYFTSSVIDQTAPSGIHYTLGMVMYNFRWTDSDNNVHDLAATLEQKKAVVLNFWFSTCGPCRTEFPFLNESYQTYRDDIEIFALSTASTDSPGVVRSYKAGLELTFPMGLDTEQLSQKFGFTSAPITVIIDRYGIIAEMHRGSVPSAAIFNNLFRKYTADNYTQTPPEPGESDVPGGETGEYAKRPEGLSVPSSAEFATALSGENVQATYEFNVTENDRDITWPWEIAVGEDGIAYASPTNYGTDTSLSALYMQLTLKRGDIFSFEYRYKTELPDDGIGGDILYVSINGETPIAEIQGDSDGKWQSRSFSPAMRDETIEVVFFYLKDASESAEDEFVAVRNFSVINAKDAPFTDLLYEAASDYDAAQHTYNTYAEVELFDDGYYHVVVDGAPKEEWPLLLVDLMTTESPWRLAHHTGSTFNYRSPDETVESARPASVYQISYFIYGESGNINYYKGDKADDSDEVLQDTYVLFENYWMQMFTPEDYYMVPVDSYLRTLLEGFCTAEAHRLNYTLSENTWLELCYYYRHTSNDDKNAPQHDCREQYNPVKGWSILNAYKIGAADFVGDAYETHVNKTYPRQTHPGMRYLFTAPKKGVYRFWSSDPLQDVDPFLYIRTNVLEDGDAENHDSHGQNVYLDEMDDTRTYDHRTSGDWGLNFETYYYFDNPGEEVVLLCSLRDGGGLGEYDLHIEFMGESYETLYTATTGGGDFTTDLDGTNIRYLAVQAQLQDDVWYPVQNQSISTKPMYIDFLNPSFVTTDTLAMLIEAGRFNLPGYGDYTATMRQYLAEATTGSGLEESNELYGKHVATDELVTILTNFLMTWDDALFGDAEGYWETFACYYAHFGPWF